MMILKKDAEQPYRRRNNWHVKGEGTGVIGLYGPDLVYEEYGWMDGTHEGRQEHQQLHKELRTEPNKS